MDIFETLRLEHSAVRGLLEEMVEKSTASDGGGKGRDWPQLLMDLKQSLIAHNRAEEAVFYDALREVPNRAEFADGKTEEHHLVESLLADLETMNPMDRDWVTKLGVLRNQIESHIAEEETQTFAILQGHLTQEEAQQMAVQFDQLREDIIDSSAYHPRGRSVISPEGVNLKDNY